MVVESLNRLSLVTPWTVAWQAPLSMGFSRQEHWSELPFPSPGDLPDPGIGSGYPALQAISLPTELPGKPLPNTKTQILIILILQMRIKKKCVQDLSEDRSRRKKVTPTAV